MQGQRKNAEAAALVESIAAQVGVLISRGKINTDDLGEALKTMMERAEEGVEAMQKLLAKLQPPLNTLISTSRLSITL